MSLFANLNIKTLMRKEMMPEENIDKQLNWLIEEVKSSGLDQTPAVGAMAFTAARIMADRAEEKRASTHRKEYGPDDQKSAVRYATCQQGLILAGGVGCGKTVAMSMLARISGCEILNVPDLALLFGGEGMGAVTQLISKYKKSALVIDDLGAESDVKSFGVNFPISEIIMQRYNLWQKSGLLTSFTTNLTGTLIAERYGERVHDRLTEMCALKVLSGGSLRR